MCGVAGYLNLSQEPASEGILKKMTDKIRHRGPDGEGQFIDGPLALGHRRLAIIDLSQAGHQPMHTPDGRYTISYNGEVYNFKELKFVLENLGHRFRSQTDTEVILNAYQEWGDEFVSRLNGMFAFVIWDKKEKNIFIARDRYGIKPFYYTFFNETFLFASEIKAFDEFPGFRKEIDKKNLLEYMTFQNFFGDRTLFQGVKIFLPGHHGNISLSSKKLKLKQYWDFHFQEPRGKVLTEDEYLEELDYLIKQAVNRQLISDVEIGAYLSGGMDSGTITALAAKQLPYIKTFTIGFDLNSASGLELAFDERPKAEHMSYLFKTEHYEMVLKSGDMERCLPKLAYHLEEPRVGQSYPNFYASKLASKFSKVVLSGCGSDEIFAGYPWRYYRSIGCKNFESYINEYYAYWQRLIPNQKIKEVFSPIWEEVKEVWTLDRFRDVYLNHANQLDTDEDYINHSLYFEAKTFLHGLLVVEDKLSMAHSLETRVPFLDNNLVDFGMKIPLKYKLSSFKSQERVNENEVLAKKNAFSRNDGKWILRKVMGNYIPEEVINRDKQGFSAPDSSWFRGESIDFVIRHLGNKNALMYQYLDYSKVQQIISDHVSGKENKRLQIWSFLNFEETLRLL